MLVPLILSDNIHARSFALLTHQLVRFAHSPARSFHSHRLSLTLFAAPLIQQQADSYIIIPHSQQHRVNRKITPKITLKITQKSTLKITQRIILTLKNLCKLH